MLTREELKLLLAAPMRRRNTLAIRILLATAVRSAELYQAKWAHVEPPVVAASAKPSDPFRWTQPA